MTPIIYLVGGALAIVAVTQNSGTMGTIFPIVVTAASVAIVGVLLLLWRRTTLRQALSAVRGAESVVATGLIEAPPVDVANLIGELRRLGFEMAGATDTTIGGGEPIRTWVLTEPAGPATTWVEVGSAGHPIAIFLSRGGDGRFLETAFPDGETIDHEHVFARPIGSSVAEALAGHQATLAEWSERSGPPLVVRTLDDYRAVETEMRERTGGLRIAAFLERVVEPGLRRWAISAGIGIITFFVIVLVPGP